MRLLETETLLEKRTDPYPLYALGDFHVGSVNCYYEKLCADIREIRDNPDSGVILMGDLVDAIAIADPRYSIDGIDSRFINRAAIKNLPRAECLYVIEKLDPIRNQIKMLLSGNHENKVRKHTTQRGVEFDPGEFIATELGVLDRYVDYLGSLTWSFRAKNAPKKGPDVITIVAQHGFGGGRLKGGKLNNMDKALNGIEADAFLMGHVHELEAARKVRNIIRREDGVLRQKAHDMLMVCTGAYLKTYESSTEYKQSEYGEIFMYEPVSIDMARLTVQPKRGIVRALI